MTESKIEKIEREYIIPLRDRIRSVPRYKRTPKAVKTVKEFLAKHMGIRDRDLKKIRLDKYLNEALWYRGIKNPIHKIKVKAVKEGDIVRAYAVDLPSNLNFKKIREEKKSLEQAKIGKEKTKEIEAQKKAEEEEMKAEMESEEAKEKDEEFKENKEAVKEEGQEEAKTAKKAVKKTNGFRAVLFFLKQDKDSLNPK